MKVQISPSPSLSLVRFFSSLQIRYFVCIYMIFVLFAFYGMEDILLVKFCLLWKMNGKEKRQTNLLHDEFHIYTNIDYVLMKHL